MNLTDYKTIFEKYLLEQIPVNRFPVNLYEPLHYVLSNGGKRIRPLLVLLSSESFGGTVKEAFPAASAIEIFHNFTLIHDDIMDKAPIRRGKPTVHTKWNENLAILSGDTMLVWGYKMLEKYEGNLYKKLSSLLNITAIEVCEGQQMDMDFERNNNVKINEYLEMIRLKTAVLLGTALKFGAIVAGTTQNNMHNIYNFGMYLGIAFQIQDDYLDSFGNSKEFGKKIGGDIIDRKKTFLFIQTIQKANKTDLKKLLNLFQNENPSIDDELIKQVLNIYKKYDIPELTRKEIDKYTNKALEFLEKTTMSKKYKAYWKQFSYELMHRSI